MNVEELRRMLADDLKALQDGKSVLGVGEMADGREARLTLHGQCPTDTVV